MFHHNLLYNMNSCHRLDKMYTLLTNKLLSFDLLFIMVYIKAMNILISKFNIINIYNHLNKHLCMN